MKVKVFMVRSVISLMAAFAVPLVFAALVRTLMPGSGAAELLRTMDSRSAWLLYLLLVISVLVLNVLLLYMDKALSESEVVDNREEGVVKWFNVSKGFGFVIRDNGDDVFVHFRSIRGRGHRSLQEGQRVKFGLVESAKGLQAEDVSVIRHQ